MAPFDYVVVLISIILGLGITQIMTGVADLVHQWNKVKLYWAAPGLDRSCFHSAYTGVVETYSLHIFTSWKLPTFLFLSLYPVTLFILARILFPFNIQGKHNDRSEAILLCQFPEVLSLHHDPDRPGGDQQYYRSWIYV
ncbi:MAG: hypothetical protein WDN75_11150 [Bacteroidota bacterium]